MLSRASRWAPILLLCGTVASSALAAEANPANPISASRGAALFEGHEPLVGRLRGHASPMPPQVLACGGCHAPRTAANPDVPSLDTPDLQTQKSRRGGPPSAYTLDTFCRAIRTGVDPVYVTLSRSMPVFVVSPEQCESLWLYLMDRSAL